MKLNKRLAAFAAALLLSFTPLAPEAADITASAQTSSYTVKKTALKTANVSRDPRILEKMTTETIVDYTSPSAAFNNNYGLKTVVYGFDTRRSAGISSLGSLVQAEADFGVTMYKRPEKSMTRLYVQAYNHTDREITVKSSYVVSLDRNNIWKKKATVSYELRKIETESFEPGLYRFETTFSDGSTVYLYFYVNGTSSAPCVAENIRASALESFVERRKALIKAIKDAGVTAANTLSNYLIYYPNYPFSKEYRCDTERWAKLAGELVESEWSSEHKAYAIFDWVINNIAYDTYRADELEYSRATTYEDWSGKYSVWETHTGVCHDYANILTIMFRSQGIPATTVGSESINHVWNIALINSRWVELDAAACCRYSVNTEDTSELTEMRLDKDGSSYMYEKVFALSPHYDDTQADMTVNDSLMYKAYYIY